MYSLFLFPFSVSRELFVFWKSEWSEACSEESIPALDVASKDGVCRRIQIPWFCSWLLISLVISIPLMFVFGIHSERDIVSSRWTWYHPASYSSATTWLSPSYIGSLFSFYWSRHSVFLVETNVSLFLSLLFYSLGPFQMNTYPPFCFSSVSYDLSFKEFSISKKSKSFHLCEEKIFIVNLIKNHGSCTFIRSHDALSVYFPLLCFSCVLACTTSQFCFSLSM